MSSPKRRRANATLKTRRFNFRRVIPSGVEEWSRRDASDMDGEAEGQVSGGRTSQSLIVKTSSKRCLDFARHDKKQGRVCESLKRQTPLQRRVGLNGRDVPPKRPTNSSDGSESRPYLTWAGQSPSLHSPARAAERRGDNRSFTDRSRPFAAQLCSLRAGRSPSRFLNPVR